MPELTLESAYEQAIRCLYERINYEKTGHAPYSDANYRLDRMRRLFAALGDPQLSAPLVHIAGTKGKGSTATLISRMLSASGLRTGLYTSPHLVRLEERFQVENQPCTAEQLIHLVEQTQRAAQRVEADGAGKATFFELTTALACLHFAQQNCQAIVLEVGLGGRLDSTNVCQPTATVITTIGLDHQAQLGDTIAEIAGEKAGIIKAGIPVISSARHPDARHAIEQQAHVLGAPLRLIDRDFTCHWSAVPYVVTAEDVRASPGSPQLVTANVAYRPNYTPSLVGKSDWQLSLLGAHHADNLSAALATMDCLAEQGMAINPSVLRQTVFDTAVTARLQVVGHAPWRLIDTAHNPDSIQATLAALHCHFPGLRRTLVLATSRDKDIDAILRLILADCDRLILTQYRNNPRALPLAELISHAESCLATQKGPPSKRSQIMSAASPAEAWALACESSGPQDLVCATGSFFLAADLLTAQLRTLS